MAALFVAVGPPTASSNDGGDGQGDVLGCPATIGTTPTWSPVNTIYSIPCVSHRTSFYASRAGSPIFFREFGFYAAVYTTSNVQRYTNWWCVDAVEKSLSSR
jgi:hypothetical protein